MSRRPRTPPLFAPALGLLVIMQGEVRGAACEGLRASWGCHTKVRQAPQLGVPRFDRRNVHI
eukprot:12885518-Prorocentrum_lima.AAC.1